MTRRDVTFDESTFSPVSNVEKEKQVISFTPEEPTGTRTDGDEEPQQQLRQSPQTVQAPNRYGFAEYADISQDIDHLEILTVKDALSGEHKTDCRSAVDSEYQSLMENNIWDIVELPDKRKPLALNGCSKSSETVKERWNVLRPVLSLRGLKCMGLTLKRFFLLFFGSPPFVHSWSLLRRLECSCTRWML